MIKEWLRKWLGVCELSTDLMRFKGETKRGFDSAKANLKPFEKLADALVEAGIVARDNRYATYYPRQMKDIECLHRIIDDLADSLGYYWENSVTMPGRYVKRKKKKERENG